MFLQGGPNDHGPGQESQRIGPRSVLVLSDAKELVALGREQQLTALYCWYGAAAAAAVLCGRWAREELGSTVLVTARL
jgi:hypothetical protein